jgi:ankyrin repeat protein
MLLNAGADVNASLANPGGRTALQAAAEKGNLELCQILLDTGANINSAAGYDSGATALQLVAIKG